MEDGFTQIPNNFFNAILVSKLNKRALKILLLIYRLTHGCQERSVKLSYSDLQTVGIGQSHAGDILKLLVKQQLVLQNEKTQEYRIDEKYLTSKLTENVTHRLERLKKIVGKQLSKHYYQKGNPEVTKTGTENIPNQEGSTNQNSNPYPLPKREVSASHRGGFSTPKDILHTSLNTAIDRNR